MIAMRKGIDYISEYHPNAKCVKGELKDGVFTATIDDDIGMVSIEAKMIEDKLIIAVGEVNV